LCIAPSYQQETTNKEQNDNPEDKGKICSQCSENARPSYLCDCNYSRRNSSHDYRYSDRNKGLPLRLIVDSLCHIGVSVVTTS